MCTRSASAFSLDIISPLVMHFLLCCTSGHQGFTNKLSFPTPSHFIFWPAPFSTILWERLQTCWGSSRSVPGSVCLRVWQFPPSCCSNETGPLHLIIFCMVASMKIWHCFRLQAIAEQKWPSKVSTFSINCSYLVEVAVIERCIPLSHSWNGAFGCLTLQQWFFSDDAEPGVRVMCWRSQYKTWLLVSLETLKTILLLQSLVLSSCIKPLEGVPLVIPENIPSSVVQSVMKMHPAVRDWLCMEHFPRVLAD